MVYLLFSVAILCSVIQNLVVKKYSTDVAKTNMCMFSSFVSLSAMIFFVVSSGGKMNFDPGFLIYSVAFSISYATCMIGSSIAVECGPLAISSLISQCSLIIPTMYGITILKEDISVWGYAGIVLVFVCIILVCPTSEKKEKTNWSKVPPKWYFWVALGFAGNGMCATVQKMQQLKFDGGYKNEFMIVALFIAAVITFVAGFNAKELKRDTVGAIKFAPVQGIANGATNMLVMVLTALVPTAVLFPVVMIGATVITFLVSVTFFREKFTRKQLLGYLLGVVALVLTNI